VGEHEKGGDKSGREVELKLRVDDLAALMKIAVAANGKIHPTITQTNAFFDTPDRALGARGLVIRLREERTKTSAKWFVTAKGPGQRSGNLTDVLEEEVEIDEARARQMRSGALDPITALEREGGPASRQSIVSFLRNTLAGRAAVLIGTFINERTCVDAELSAAAAPEQKFHATLELDRTRFPPRDGVEQVHHEVEMEIPTGVDHAMASRALDELFARAGVAGRGAPGKARRFFAALRGERLE
jgi:hypothetical protein